MTSDNSAVISCESVLAILDHEGCQHLSRLSSGGYVFLAYSDLGLNILNIQVVKKAFVQRFWKIAGQEVVRNVVQSRLEAVCFRGFGSFNASLVLVLNKPTLCR